VVKSGSKWFEVGVFYIFLPFETIGLDGKEPRVWIGIVE
jgi:hypothetical protein